MMPRQLNNSCIQSLNQILKIKYQNDNAKFKMLNPWGNNTFFKFCILICNFDFYTLIFDISVIYLTRQYRNDL